MPLWESLLASLAAGVAVSCLNRFGLSQISTPCEQWRKRKRRAKRGETLTPTSSEEDGSTMTAVNEFIQSGGE